MPELIQNGPDIPVELMNRLDDGRVVFFCGAGVSVGSGLPGFRGLIDDVYSATKESPTALEQGALERKQLDKALGLIEGRLIAGQLRQKVIERLSVPWTGTLDVHKAILTLSRTKTGGLRLVTTNFDDRFHQAGADERFIDAAPKLPIPKNDSWGSLVHLHGRIIPSDDGRSLVLTAADFGRAYLTERWAARFITELFREFTVVFVGYSLDDPVMGYMVDALAAERARGASFGRAYAFAAFRTESERETAKNEWLGKNVEPILYCSDNKHELLNGTLVEWARIHTDPIFSRNQIALIELKKTPTGINDPAARRLCWAISDPATAQEIAKAPPLTADAEYPTLAAWIGVLDEAGFLSAADHGPQAAPAIAPIADTGLRSLNPPNLGSVTRHLAWWIARHAHVSQVLEWVVRKGSRVHPHFADMIRQQLAKPETPIPPKLRFLWTVVLSNQHDYGSADLWRIDQAKTAALDDERRYLTDELIESIRPQLKIMPGPSSHLQFRRIYDKTTTPLTPLEACAHTEVSLGGRELAYGTEDFLAKPEVLARHAWQLTSHLERAIELLGQDDGSSRRSIHNRPSIAEHPQNRRRPDWTQLIDWARDSYSALKRVSPAKAAGLLQWWAASPHPLFRRLALHSITEDPKAYILLARPILLEGKEPGLWDMELHREALRFFRLAGRRLPAKLRAEIVLAVKAGPKVRRGKGAKKWDREYVDYSITLRLAKLARGGAKLDKASMARAATLPSAQPGEPEERNEFLTWSGEGGFVSRHELTGTKQTDASIPALIKAISEKSIGLEEFEGVALSSLLKAIAALRRLGKQNATWPGPYWQRLFWAVRGLRHQGKLHPRMEGFLVSFLPTIPDAVFVETGSAAADFVEEIAKKYPVEREDEIRRLWHKAWGGISHSAEVDSKDVLTSAINHSAGKLAEAALHRLWMRKPRIGDEFPSEIVTYFDQIAQSPGGILGRVILASRLFHLFGVSPKWTAANLLPRMSWQSSPEAKTLWAAYAWSPTIGPNLLAAIKTDFLLALKAFSTFEDEAENLIGLFVSTCLEAPHELTPDEIDGVIRSLPEKGLVEVTDRLEQRLKGTDEERATIWRAKIGPWLAAHWPHAADRNTSGTSRGLVDIARQTGTAFPEAIKLLLPYLKPIGDRFLWHIDHDQLAAKSPEAVLSLLVKTVTKETLQTWERAILKKILDKLQEVDPSMRARQDFQNLYRIATQ